MRAAALHQLKRPPRCNAQQTMQPGVPGHAVHHSDTTINQDSPSMSRQQRLHHWQDETVCKQLKIWDSPSTKKNVASEKEEEEKEEKEETER